MANDELTRAREMVCEWMERTGSCDENWPTNDLTLDALREVEERLSEEQRKSYVAWFQFPPPIWQAVPRLRCYRGREVAARAVGAGLESREASTELRGPRRHRALS